MLRAFSFPMSLERIRNRERLEASLAGLCELDFLKQRQEYLVHSALRIGLQGNKTAAPRALQAEPARRSQDDFTSRQQLNGLVSSLEQQVEELHVHGGCPLLTDPSSELGDSRPSSGFYELSESLSPIGQSDSSVFGDFLPGYSRMGGLAEARMNYANERPKSVGTAEGRYPWDSPYSFPGPSQMGSCYSEQPYQDSGEQPSAGDFQQAHRVESYILGLLQRRALPPRPSIPRTSLSSEPPKGLARQSSLCRRQAESGESRYTQGGSINPSQGFEGKARPLWAGQGMEQVESYREEALSQLYQRQPLRPTSLEYRHQEQASLEPNLGEAGSEPEYQEDLEEQEYPQSPTSAFQYCEAYQEYCGQRSPLADEEMVSAQYIPAQQSGRSSGAHSYQRHLSKQASFGGRSRGESPRSPERFPFQHPSRAKTTPKKCRFTEDGGPRSGAKKSGKQACRSQSENSLMGQRGAPERRYNTVEREEEYGRGAQQQQQQQQQRPKRASGSGGSSGSSEGGYRKWRSTLEISQDEDESQSQRRSRKQRLPPLPVPPPPSRPLYQADFGEPLSPPRAPVCLPEEDLRGYAVGDSESSLSEEADSPGSSSLSSDSDESGGLVWPQQLPPKLGGPPSSSSCSSPSSSSACTPAGAQPKVFVKIKASHALKKKILRFRTGSLKVMTTV
ncbi:UNVERIFIED_CONTAM: hypothetical protein FKN15_073354 [Acipenser sinensis]